MEYNFIKVKNNKLFYDNEEIEYKFNNNEKFGKALSNLLAIKSRGDSAVFTTINKSNIDLFSLLNEGDINKIYSNANFKIKIPRKTLKEINNIIDKIITKKDLINAKDELNIPQTKINLWKFRDDIELEKQDGWDILKNEIIEINKSAIASFNSKWTRFIKNYLDIYEQENIWPLYIGTFFIKGNIKNKSIYAPLIFKEVELIEERNEIYISSKNDSIIINEKLSFFLEEYKNWNIPEINEEKEQISFFDCTNELTHFFKDIIKFEDFSIIKKFNKLKSQEINDVEISREPGIVLMISNPVGSGLRRALIDLLNEGKLDGNLIKSESNGFDLDDTKYINQIIDEQKGVSRICKTDFSQEKAIMASLEDSTIIIGPPGTGKSQTIANIISNIMYENKTALFISQKKVALQVVLERLKELKFFTLQLIENANKKSSTEKEFFYHNLNKFLEIVSKSYSLKKDDQHIFKSLVSENLKKYWNNKNIEVEDIDIDIFCELKENIPLLDIELINSFYENKNQYNNLSEKSINGFTYFKQELLNKFSKDFFKIIESNKEGLNNLNWNEITNFINLQTLYNSIDINQLNTLLKNKEKLISIDWKTIEKFEKIYQNINDKNKNKILDLLISMNDIFIQLKHINKFNCIDKLHNLSYNEDKELFAREFGISKKKVFIFKMWDKDFKNFWDVNTKLKNKIMNFNISRTLINDLKENDEFINTWISNIDFLHFIVTNKINEKVYNEIKKNLDYINVWIKYFNFINTIKEYSLNQNHIQKLKENQELFNNWIDNFEFYNYINKYDLKYNSVEIINKINNNENIKKIYKIYIENHNDFISNNSEFIDDKNIIFKNLANKIWEIANNFDAEEREEFRKLKGRIERKYTKPYVLISKFKKLFKKLFNVVVSTPESLATYVDFLNEKYDYVIFDEASQMFLEKAIPFLAIGEKIIIAGDDQQMQPTNWFGLRVDNEDQYEQEDENIDSLLTYAINSGIKKQTLELNYRSDSANLTSFSSKHFYNSKLKCLDNNNSNISDSIEVIDVNGKWENSINIEEAEKMVLILKENINNYERIILLTFNADQMNYLDFILSNNEPEIYKKISIDRTIILKNLENIQGDEGDLVITSVAYTKDTKLSGTYICRDGGKNALNVAITRAKKKMIVIKSIYSSDINPTNDNISLFKYWLSFIESNKEEQKNYSIPEESITNSIMKADSGFEIDVLNWLGNQKFEKEIYCISQYPIGSYKIDIAILDKKNSRFLLGIEVDGYRYHSSPIQKYNDEIRQSFIESKGYKLMRIPELLWRSDKKKILETINKYLI